MATLSRHAGCRTEDYGSYADVGTVGACGYCARRALRRNHRDRSRESRGSLAAVEAHYTTLVAPLCFAAVKSFSANP
jgi:hypothetical protein